MTFNSIRVLVIPADVDLVSQDHLEEEADLIRSRFASAKMEAEVRPFAPQGRESLSIQLQESRTNILHVTNHGSAAQHLSIPDTAGWLRRISGRTLASNLRSAGIHLDCAFFSNCTLYGGLGALADAAEYAFSVRSKNNGRDLSQEITGSFYSHLSETPDYHSAYLGVLRELSEPLNRGEMVAQSSMQLEIRAFRQDAPAYGVERPRARNIRGRRDMAGASSPTGPRSYRVWFGTNRRSIGGAAPFFSGERDTTTHYGSCEVTIPKDHKIGTVGDSWRERFKIWEDNRLRISKVDAVPAASFWSGLSHYLGSLPIADRTLLIFVHGYNIDFQESAIRAAQLGFDLKIRGTTAFFSWPSKGVAKAYAADAASIEASESPIESSILDMSKRSGATQLFLIVHSMGNRGVLRALERIVARVSAHASKSLSQIILAAPDVDTQVFKTLSGVYSKMCTRTTMYVSEKDKALLGSKFLYDYPRAGYSPPITVVNGVDTVEVSRVDLSLLGHGYVAAARPVLADICSLFESNLDPNRRKGLEKRNSTDGDYWAFV